MRFSAFQFDHLDQLSLIKYHVNASRTPTLNAAPEYVRKRTTVARFFFHFSSRHQFVRDPKGRELEHIGAAHRHALLLIEKAVLLLSHELDWSGWSIDVSDKADRTLLSVLFPRSVAILRLKGIRPQSRS